MAADDGDRGKIGATLLAEVEAGETHLDSFLLSIHQELNRASVFHIEELDQIVELVHGRSSGPTLQPDKTTAQHGPIIQLAGSKPGCGKTHLLYLIVAMSTLPDTLKSVPLQGKAAAVVVIDNDGCFDVRRLSNVMKTHVLRCCGKENEVLQKHEVQAVAEEALKHVHIFRPQSLASMLATLREMYDYLIDNGKHYSGERRLDGILVDSISAFYWQDKFEGALAENQSSIDELYQGIVKALKDLSAKLGAFVVATNWGLYTAEASDDSMSAFTNPRGQGSTNFSEVPLYRSHLPSVWNSFVDLKLVLQRESGERFSKFTSLEKVMKALEIEKSTATTIVSCWVDTRSLKLELQRKLTGGNQLRISIGTSEGVQFVKSV